VRRFAPRVAPEVDIPSPKARARRQSAPGISNRFSKAVSRARRIIAGNYRVNLESRPSELFLTTAFPFVLFIALASSGRISFMMHNLVGV
jgi:hypothetical protein